MVRHRRRESVCSSRLSCGQFYVAVDGRPFRKARTPLCLSHHPASPLSSEEVIARAQRGASESEAAAIGQ